jgi:hypothetical protein
MVNPMDLCTIAPFPLFVVDVQQANALTMSAIMGPSHLSSPSLALLRLNGMMNTLTTETPEVTTMTPNNKNNGGNCISAEGFEAMMSVGGGANVSAASTCILSSCTTRLGMNPSSAHRPTTAHVDTNSAVLSDASLDACADQQAAATIHEPAPCQHNNWDNLRAKSSIATLCCRDCSKKWKQRFPIKMLCPEFHMERMCAFGVHCPFLHVHRYKSIEKSPNAVGHVTRATRNAEFANIAIDVLAENPNLWPRDVVDQVRLRYIAAQEAAELTTSANSVASNESSAPKTPQQRTSGFAVLPVSFFSRGNSMQRNGSADVASSQNPNPASPSSFVVKTVAMTADGHDHTRHSSAAIMERAPQRCAMASRLSAAHLFR